MTADPTIRACLDSPVGLRMSSSSGSPLAPPKASPAPETRASAMREILALLDPAASQPHAAMESTA